MKSIDIEYDLPADPDRVFRFLTDLGQMRRWRSLSSLRVEPPGPAAVGTRLYSTVRGMGRQMSFINEVTDLDPERRFYRDRFVEGTFPIQSSWRVTPHGGGARLTWHTEYEGRGIMRPLGSLLGRIIRQGQLQDLAKVRGMLGEP